MAVEYKIFDMKADPSGLGLYRGGVLELKELFPDSLETPLEDRRDPNERINEYDFIAIGDKPLQS